MKTTTRAEHLDWCKRRALEYVKIGDTRQAFASMTSDLSKHPETERHAGIGLGARMFFAGFLETPTEMEKFIRGFN
jgi:hypothetical protein